MSVNHGHSYLQVQCSLNDMTIITHSPMYSSHAIWPMAILAQGQRALSVDLGAGQSPRHSWFENHCGVTCFSYFAVIVS